ncbi:MAG: fasciclin domain-containing protein [Pricia sp.]
MKILAKSILIVLIFTVSLVSAQKNRVSSLAPTEPQNVQKSILNSTAASGKHQTLLAILKATDFGELLDRKGPFTVFAPSDLAFKNSIGTSVADLLHPDNKEELKALMGYHIIAGKLSASKILKALCAGKGVTTFTTVQGDVITATMNGLDIILNDSFGNTATIVVADSNQRNGVIHEIDGVIKPVKM